MKLKSTIIAFFGLITISIGAYAISMAYSDFLEDKAYKDRFIIREGILANHAKTVRFNEQGRPSATVKLEEPVVVSQSEIPLEWGYYQFPSIFKMYDGNLLVTWQMKEDSFYTLGGKDKGKNMMLSTDQGRTWIDYDNRYNPDLYYYSIKRLNGECFLISGSVFKNVSTINNFPKPVCEFEEKATVYTLYKESEMPAEYQGLYITRWIIQDSVVQNKTTTHFYFEDDGLYRCAFNDHILKWVGRVRELSNKDVIACNYTSYHTDDSGKILPCGISFYKVNLDEGTFIFQGEIPFTPDLKADPKGNMRKGMGYSEPSFIELNNGYLLCVARSTFEFELTPLYRSFSNDEGKTWTKPEAFTPNGVDPSIISMGNGTLVLASGRPGVQLRFCFDGKGIDWTEPIEMMHHPYIDGKLITLGGSCGYTDLIPNDDNSFFMVYSIFDNGVEKGKYRKSIMFRKVTISK